MNRVPMDPSLTDIESLFVLERELVREPDEVRSRAVQRAQTAMVSGAVLGGRWMVLQRWSLAKAAAAVALLVGLCAIAFEAGYRVKNRMPTTPAPKARVLALTEVDGRPADSALPASADQSEASVEPVPPTHRPAKARVAGRHRTPAETANDALELRVLQPALEAVARHDFAAALIAIAVHQQHFPSGQLAEEREALRVKALVGLGRRADAERAGLAFRERFPRSALLDQIRQILGTDR